MRRPCLDCGETLHHSIKHQVRCLACRLAVQRKVCRRCETDLPFEAFYEESTSDGRASACRSCKYSETNALRAATRERSLEYARLGQRSRRYNITPDDYESMMAAQEGRCLICHRHASEAGALHVDHDHSCCPGRRSCGGCVRGLLCKSCNLKFGWFEKHAVAILRYAQYPEVVAA